MNRKMIIIGSSNNYNELGLVRSFGVCGIKPYGIIICKEEAWKHDWLHRSKYWMECNRVDTAEEALQLLQEKYGSDINKAVVTTPVDYVMQMIDKQYDSLSVNFILQSINGEGGRINSLANKLAQAQLTEQLGFRTLPTKILEISQFDAANIAPEEYPILLKPVAGGEGSKDDITICRDAASLNAAIAKFAQKKYVRILCQTYLENRTELATFGALERDKRICSFTILKNIRQWPDSYGVGSLGEIVTDQNILSFVESLYEALLSFGYDGPLDVDVFIDNATGQFYVSEYNWRPGGRNYTSLGTHVYSIVLWYLAKCDQYEATLPVKNTTSGYSMNDGTDINHVLQGSLSIREWFKDFKKASSHALWFKKDLAPVVIPYMSIFKKALRNKLQKRR